MGGGLISRNAQHRRGKKPEENMKALGVVFTHTQSRLWLVLRDDLIRICLWGP